MSGSLCLPEAISRHAPGVAGKKRFLHGAFELSSVNRAMDLERNRLIKIIQNYHDLNPLLNFREIIILVTSDPFSNCLSFFLKNNALERAQNHVNRMNADRTFHFSRNWGGYRRSKWSKTTNKCLRAFAKWIWRNIIIKNCTVSRAKIRSCVDIIPFKDENTPIRGNITPCWANTLPFQGRNFGRITPSSGTITPFKAKIAPLLLANIRPFETKLHYSEFKLRPFEQKYDFLGRNCALSETKMRPFGVKLRPWNWEQKLHLLRSKLRPGRGKITHFRSEFSNLEDTITPFPGARSQLKA